MARPSTCSTRETSSGGTTATGAASGESVPVVVGAFPEPFLHGYDGKVRPAVVIGASASARMRSRGSLHGTRPLRARPRARTCCGSSAARRASRRASWRAARSSSRFAGNAKAARARSGPLPLPLLRAVRPSAAALVLLGVAVAALVAHRLWAVGVLAFVLLAVCLRAGRRAKPYLWGTLFSAGFVFLLSPLLQSTGYHVLWSGPDVPVLGRLDVTTEELRIAGINALRLAAVGLAFAAYALLLDHDRLIAAATARRSVLAARSGDASGADARARRRRARRGAARPRPGAGRPARPRGAALAAARRLARARAQPRRGDGGEGLRPAR